MAAVPLHPGCSKFRQQGWQQWTVGMAKAKASEFGNRSESQQFSIRHFDKLPGLRILVTASFLKLGGNDSRSV